MKIFFKILVGIMIVSIICSCLIFIFNSDLSKLKFWEKDAPDTDGDSLNTLPLDTETAGDFLIPGDGASEEDILIEGAYKVKSDIDFSSLPVDKITLSNVQFVTAAAKCFNPELNSIYIDETGVWFYYMGSNIYVYRSETGTSDTCEGYSIVGISFQSSLTVTPEDVSYDMYEWFVSNFETYIVPEVYELSGIYYPSANLDFSKLKGEYNLFCSFEYKDSSPSYSYGNKVFGPEGITPAPSGSNWYIDIQGVSVVSAEFYEWFTENFS